MVRTREGVTPRERRVARALAARGEEGLGEALQRLRGVRFGSRYRCESLYAVGGEGAVYLVRDVLRPGSPMHVAKVALLPYHRPFELGARTIRQRREIISIEATYLRSTGGTFLPHHLGTFDFQNPLLDPARGGPFRAPGPVIVMEKLPGHDLDRWLARVHRSRVPRAALRRTLDRVAVVLLRALVELLDRELIYADLRPANLRMLPRPQHHMRLLDAGSLVTTYDRSGRFPHVPAYLPPDLVRNRSGGEIVPTVEIQAVMAGRTLYEVATGLVPHVGEEIDEERLAGGIVSPAVAETISELARGRYRHVRDALRALADRATRHVVKPVPAPPVSPQPVPVPAAPPDSIVETRRRAGSGISLGPVAIAALRGAGPAEPLYAVGGDGEIYIVRDYVPAPARYCVAGLSLAPPDYAVPRASPPDGRRLVVAAMRRPLGEEDAWLLLHTGRERARRLAHNAERRLAHNAERRSAHTVERRSAHTIERRGADDTERRGAHNVEPRGAHTVGRGEEFEHAGPILILQELTRAETARCVAWLRRTDADGPPLPRSIDRPALRQLRLLASREATRPIGEDMRPAELRVLDLPAWPHAVRQALLSGTRHGEVTLPSTATRTVMASPALYGLAVPVGEAPPSGKDRPSQASGRDASPASPASRANAPAHARPAAPESVAVTRAPATAPAAAETAWSPPAASRKARDSRVIWRRLLVWLLRRR